jgi:hypothetical protein
MKTKQMELLKKSGKYFEIMILGYKNLKVAMDLILFLLKVFRNGGKFFD